MEIVVTLLVLFIILGFMLCLVWLALPILVLLMKAKVDRSLELLAMIDRRLQNVENQLLSSAPCAKKPSPDAALPEPIPPEVSS